MKVVVIGAGIGGLVLAHTLRGFGVDVHVYDRDVDLECTGSYRLHLDSNATDVLRRRISPEAYRALLASASGPEMFRQVSVLDQSMRQLVRIPNIAGEDDMLIGRIPLRTILAVGLDDVVHFGCEFTDFTVEDDDTVTAHFADGSTVHADVLVAADGAGSPITATLAGKATAEELPLHGLSGRTPVTDRSLLPSAVGSGPAFAIGPKGLAVFLSFHDPRTSVMVPTTCADVPAHPEDPYLIWGAVIDGKLGDVSTPPTAEDLFQKSITLFDGWSRQLRRLIESTDIDSLRQFPYLAGDPDNIVAWAPGPVTALGDALHAMPPTVGPGAATAIRDADHLGVKLAIAAKGTTTLEAALRDYHRLVVPYAAEAIREALHPLSWRSKLDNQLSYQVLRRVLPVADRVKRLVS